MELEHLEMQLIDLQTNPIRTNKLLNTRERIDELERIHNEETDCGVGKIILEACNNIPDTYFLFRRKIDEFIDNDFLLDLWLARVPFRNQIMHIRRLGTD